MKRLVRSIGKLIVLGLFVVVAIFAATKNAQAIPMASVTYLETWDSANWDYEYYVKNQSNAGEYLYDFFLDVDPTMIAGISLSNISDPTNWTHWTDDSTYIEWGSLSSGSDIAPGNSLAFNFSSDTQLGDLYYELFTADASGFPLDPPNDIISGTSAPVPEPATMLLLGAGVISALGFKKKFS